MEIKYRHFTNEDFQEISNQMLALYEDDPEGEPISLEKIERTFKYLSSYPDSGTILLLTLESKTIGYALIVHYWSNEYGGNILVLDELYVKTEFRSLGIGTEFIHHLKESKLFNMVAIELEVAPNNVRANQLYKELGFKLSLNQNFIFK